MDLNFERDRVRNYCIDMDIGQKHGKDMDIRINKILKDVGCGYVVDMTIK